MTRPIEGSANVGFGETLGAGSGVSAVVGLGDHGVVGLAIVGVPLADGLGVVAGTGA